MSSWGYTDNATIAGTVSAYTQNVNVVGASTYFTVNIKDGDYLYISGKKYKVDAVASNTALTLTNVAAANISGATAYVQQGPKFLSNIIALGGGDTARQNNVATIQNVYGVTLNEMYSNVANGATITNVGAAYVAAAVANTYANVYTTGATQPVTNANVALTFSGNILTAITVTNPGAGYTVAAISNTVLGIYTTGLTQPTTNATANLTFTSAATNKSNAHHQGWVSYRTYTDAYGQVRIKTEVLAAMSKNFTNATAGDNDPDDTIFPH
jgi:hypothetical protein